MNAKTDTPFPTYKGKPLVRCGDVIYYGDMRDKYVVKLEIKSKKKVQDLEAVSYTHLYGAETALDFILPVPPPLPPPDPPPFRR